MNNVIISLAHHLDADSAERLGLPKHDLSPGTEIVVAEDVAKGLIGAGYAAVEAERPREVAKALKRHAPQDVKVGVYEESQEAQGPDDGKTIAEKGATNADAGQGTAPAASRKASSAKE